MFYSNLTICGTRLLMIETDFPVLNSWKDKFFTLAVQSSRQNTPGHNSGQELSKHHPSELHSCYNSKHCSVENMPIIYCHIMKPLGYMVTMVTFWLCKHSNNTYTQKLCIVGPVYPDSKDPKHSQSTERHW